MTATVVMTSAALFKKKAAGPGYCTEAQREDWLFDNRSNRPRDDLKDVCPTRAIELTIWECQNHGFTLLQQPGLVFPSETAVLDPLFQRCVERNSCLCLSFCTVVSSLQVTGHHNRHGHDDGQT